MISILMYIFTLQKLPVPLLKKQEWLTDEHIHSFQDLLKIKYNLNGLELTLLLKQKREWKSIPVDFVQVVARITGCVPVTFSVEMEK